MMEAQLLPWIGWGLLGTLLLLMLHRIIAQSFSPSARKCNLQHLYSRATTFDEEGDSMAAIYAMDTALMNAEFDKPGLNLLDILSPIHGGIRPLRRQP